MPASPLRLRQSSGIQNSIIDAPSSPHLHLALTTIPLQRQAQPSKKRFNGAVREPDVSTELRSVLLLLLFALASNYSAFNYSAPNYSSPWVGVVYHSSVQT